MKNTLYIFVLTVLFASCTGMYDIMEPYAGEKVYPGKFDTLLVDRHGYIGYNRVEIDLLNAGRIPTSEIKMGKAKKTVIEYDQEKIIIDSLVSWVNITGLTLPKLYRFRIYTIDNFNNPSVVETIALIPYTDEEKDMLEVPAPRIVYSGAGATIQWPGGISSVMMNFHELEYEYQDKNKNTQSGKVTDARVGIPVENVEPGAEITIQTSYTVTPIRNETKPILDRVQIERPMIFRMATNFAVSYNVVGEGGILAARIGFTPVSSGSLIDAGVTVIFVATPSSGYRVKEWRNNGIAVNGTATTYTLANLSEITNVTVAFESVPRIDFSVTGGNGTLVAADDNGTPINSGAIVEAGTTVVFTATPNPGFRVKDWKNNGETVNGVNTQYTIEVLRGHNVTVEYEPMPKLNFSIVDNVNGTLAVADNNGAPISDGAFISEGTTVTFTATPDPGYRVKGWTNNDAKINGTNNEYTFVVSGNHNVTVEFEPIPAITFSVVNGNGTLSIVIAGDMAIFKATPDPGYRVKKWTDNGETVNGTNTEYTIIVLEDHNVTVEFEPV